MIKLKADGKKIDFTVSKFPDGTSQVWQLTDNVEKYTYFKIDFLWENKEEEIFHLLMLMDLINTYVQEPYIYLNIPYLPFARQDKTISNISTFALQTFASLINSKKPSVVVSFDVHSKAARKLIKNFESINPIEFHNWAFYQSKVDYGFYPDAGAAQRYSRGINEIPLYGEKIRNQITGNIEGYKVLNSNLFDLTGKDILIVDDLCDGGATFITAAKALKELGVKNIDLCVSHGVYSKGKDEMIKAGIRNFYTTNSLIKNSEGYNVWE